MGFGVQVLDGSTANMFAATRSEVARSRLAAPAKRFDFFTV